jgi:hypothetical protein
MGRVSSEVASLLCQVCAESLEDGQIMTEEEVTSEFSRWMQCCFVAVQAHHPLRFSILGAYIFQVSISFLPDQHAQACTDQPQGCQVTIVIRVPRYHGQDFRWKAL